MQQAGQRCQPCRRLHGSQTCHISGGLVWMRVCIAWRLLMYQLTGPGMSWGPR